MESVVLAAALQPLAPALHIHDMRTVGAAIQRRAVVAVRAKDLGLVSKGFGVG